MTKTERLEVALRELYETVSPIIGIVRLGDCPSFMEDTKRLRSLKTMADKTVPAFDAARAALAALADTAPSCCEETRRATLTEAIAATCPSCREGVPFRNNVRPGVLAYQHFQQTTVQDGEPRGLVNECHAMTLRALSNQAPPKSPPVCPTCDDTHAMRLGDRKVMCTHCPTPCAKCRTEGTGAYCAKTPCDCACHPDCAGGGK